MILDARKIICESLTPASEVDVQGLPALRGKLVFKLYTGHNGKIGKCAATFKGEPPWQGKAVPATDFETQTVNYLKIRVLDQTGVLACFGTREILGEKDIDLRPTLDSLTHETSVEHSVSLSQVYGATVAAVTTHFCWPQRGPVHLYLRVGIFTQSPVPDKPETVFCHVPIRSLPKGIDNASYLSASHSFVNHSESVVLTCRVLHSVDLLQSALYVYYQDKMAAVAHLVGLDQLPLPTQIFDPRKVPYLNPRAGERAVLIKNHSGDWAVVIGRWTAVRKGGGSRMGSRRGKDGLPGQLLIRVREMAEFGWRELTLNYSDQHWRFTMDDLHADLKDGTIRIDNPDSQFVAEKVALTFSVALLHVLCMPRPSGWRRGTSLRPRASRRGTRSSKFIPSEEMPFILAAGVLQETPTNGYIRQKHGISAWTSEREALLGPGNTDLLSCRPEDGLGGMWATVTPGLNELFVQGSHVVPDGNSGCSAQIFPDGNSSISATIMPDGNSSCSQIFVDSSACVVSPPPPESGNERGGGAGGSGGEGGVGGSGGGPLIRKNSATKSLGGDRIAGTDKDGLYGSSKQLSTLVVPGTRLITPSPSSSSLGLPGDGGGAGSGGKPVLPILIVSEEDLVSVGSSSCGDRKQRSPGGSDHRSKGSAGLGGGGGERRGGSFKRGARSTPSSPSAVSTPASGSASSGSGEKQPVGKSFSYAAKTVPGEKSFGISALAMLGGKMSASVHGGPPSPLLRNLPSVAIQDSCATASSSSDTVEANLAKNNHGEITDSTTGSKPLSSPLTSVPPPIVLAGDGLETLVLSGGLGGRKGGGLAPLQLGNISATTRNMLSISNGGEGTPSSPSLDEDDDLNLADDAASRAAAAAAGGGGGEGALAGADEEDLATTPGSSSTSSSSRAAGPLSPLPPMLGPLDPSQHIRLGGRTLSARDMIDICEERIYSDYRCSLETGGVDDLILNDAKYDAADAEIIVAVQSRRNSRRKDAPSKLHANAEATKNNAAAGLTAGGGDGGGGGGEENDSGLAQEANFASSLTAALTASLGAPTVEVDQSRVKVKDNATTGASTES